MSDCSIDFLNKLVAHDLTLFVWFVLQQEAAGGDDDDDEVEILDGPPASKPSSSSSAKPTAAKTPANLFTSMMDKAKEKAKEEKELSGKAKQDVKALFSMTDDDGLANKVSAPVKIKRKTAETAASTSTASGSSSSAFSASSFAPPSQQPAQQTGDCPVCGTSFEDADHSSCKEEGTEGKTDDETMASGSKDADAKPTMPGFSFGEQSNTPALFTASFDSAASGFSFSASAPPAFSFESLGKEAEAEKAKDKAGGSKKDKGEKDKDKNSMAAVSLFPSKPPESTSEPTTATDCPVCGMAMGDADHSSCQENRFDTVQLSYPPP